MEELPEDAPTKGVNRYAIGRRFEYRTRDRLRKLGFFVVRAAGSKGKVDLIAARVSYPGLGFPDGATGKLAAIPKLLFVQCKRHGAIGVEEWNLFFADCELAGAVPLLCRASKENKLEFFLLTDRKTGQRGKRQPMEPYAVV